MARIPQVQKDKTRRKLFSVTEKVQRLLKYRSLNMGFSKLFRDKANSKLSLINAKGYKSRIKNRCIFTGKSRSILRKFGISQTSVRALARSGSIAGIKKASW